MGNEAEMIGEKGKGGSDIKALRLGASLYVPCTRKDIPAVARGEKIPGLRSAIFCLEDAVREDELEEALENLEAALAKMEPNERMLRFVRVRNERVLSRVLGMAGVGQLDGFVIPKATAENLGDYMRQIGQASQALGKKLWAMPTLETQEAFDPAKLREMRDLALEMGWDKSILSFRVGGNDLMSLLGVRRSRSRTIYDSPLAPTLANIVATFKPYGFNVTAPVFELLDSRELLASEVERDLEFGFVGKTAIHPDQIPLIESRYQAFADDLETAKKILDKDAPAVFRCQGAMCEPTTHIRWANAIVERSRVYGISFK